MKILIDSTLPYLNNIYKFIYKYNVKTIDKYVDSFYNFSMTNRVNVGTMLNSLVPISHLNQGKAAQIIGSLGPDDVKIIVKNNEPMAAIIPIERFSELMEIEERVKGDK